MPASKRGHEHIRTSKPRREVALDIDVWEAALQRVRHAITLVDEFTVMFSGGKDSTVTLHAVLEVAAELGRLPVRTIFIDEEAIPMQTEEYMRRVGERDDVALEWYCLPFRNRNACSRREPYWWPWAPESEDLWVRPLPPEAITHLEGFPDEPPNARIQHEDTNGLFHPGPATWATFMGIRAQESLTRRRAVTSKRAENFIVDLHVGKVERPLMGPWAGPQATVKKVYPVYDWTTEDVWTAPAMFDWDYNRAYDVMEMAGVTHLNQRCSPAYGEEPLMRLYTYAECFPDVWPKMTDRVPGAAAAARYARTELYGFGRWIGKPPDVSWETMLERTIEKWADPRIRAKVAKRIKAEIRAHYSVTDDPLVDEAPHPLTGASWSYLLNLAQRGDFKGRRQSGKRIGDTGNMDRYWETYNAERQALGL